MSFFFKFYFINCWTLGKNSKNLWSSGLCVSRSVMSNCLQPHGLSTSRLFHPWDFFRQEYWSGLPFLSPEHLTNPGIKPGSPTLQADSSVWATREALTWGFWPEAAPILPSAQSMGRFSQGVTGCEDWQFLCWNSRGLIWFRVMNKAHTQQYCQWTVWKGKKIGHWKMKSPGW